MKITEKIRLTRRAILANPTGPTAIKISNQSIDAILRQTPDSWETYMKNFSSNDQQLQRLLGNEQSFMNRPDNYGRKLLAYLAGSGPCGGGTALGLIDNMDPAIKNLLDTGLPDDTAEGESFAKSAEIQLFLDAES